MTIKFRYKLHHETLPPISRATWPLLLIRAAERGNYSHSIAVYEQAGPAGEAVNKQLFTNVYVIKL